MRSLLFATRFVSSQSRRRLPRTQFTQHRFRDRQELNLTEAQIGALVAFLIDALTDERIPMLLATLCMAMPRQQRLGRDDRGDLLQNFATNFLAFAARRHLWSSVKRSRRPICARRTRFSSTRYSITCCCLRFQPIGNRNDEKRKRI
jgi:hypothetical protein